MLAKTNSVRKMVEIVPINQDFSRLMALSPLEEVTLNTSRELTDDHDAFLFLVN